MNSLFLIYALTIGALSAIQDTAPVGDFAKSPTEHIINHLERPFVVKSVRGSVSREQGDHEPLANVLFELQGPGGDQRIRRTLTDKHGRFKLGHIPEGTYKFKATLNGFQSVMGIIKVSKRLGQVDDVKIEMAVGV